MKKISIFFLALLFISCNAQNKKINNNNDIKKDTMEYFNINMFNENSKGGKTSVIEEKDYKLIQRDYGTFYAEDYKMKKTPVVKRKCYSKKNGVLIYSKTNFYEFPVGITKEYNQEGKLIKEINQEKDYNFSPEQLCELIKDEYNIDLKTIPDYNNPQAFDYSVDRYKMEVYPKDFRYIYRVRFRISSSEEGGPTKSVTIDATTGKILYEEWYQSQYKEYFDLLPKSKTKVEIREKSYKKEFAPLGNNDNNNNNNKTPDFLVPLILAIILIALIIGGIIYNKYQEEVEYEKTHSIFYNKR